MALAAIAPVIIDELPTTRLLSTKDLMASLRDGWHDFTENRGELVFVGLFYPVVILLVATVAIRGDLFQVLFPLVAGMSLLGPAIATGFYEMAKRRESGDEPGWGHFFDIVHLPTRSSIATLTMMLACLFLAWLGAAAALYTNTMGYALPDTFGAFLTSIVTTPEGWTLIVLGNFLGFCFAGIVLSISVISFPMLVDRDVSATTALRTSLKVVRANPRTIAIWGGIVACLLAVGALTFFVGLAVVLPVLGYSTWHLYRRAVGD
ncbi:hypothetical protein C1T17_20640 (plasmid) [Sphingobium sp. SCG-1]|uniref:DUF2189 domain-containing protein n=1 Tax=Sphingobium sp. SCG-1 TaxID=2072936 RepID=UPI000CD6B5B7|nr:DUF2189 domain-containing protein [Sphingobium sp. SCG-1]AUW60616.1 hypothetical protein C1T17_20640 [Sphingobium sp. SCG-1]